MAKALELEGNISTYVKNGGGLLLIPPRAITTQNTLQKFSRISRRIWLTIPKQQKFQVRLADSSHPLVQHSVRRFRHSVDRTLFYKNAYANLVFHTFTYFNNAEIEAKKRVKI